jgi:muramoyltetrapeptide carboxypeptidase
MDSRAVEVFTTWRLEVEVADHVFDELGHYLAGTDEDRLADLNDALGDPGVRAVFATRGGKGAYRIVEGVDFEAARRDPKPLVGFSDITILHLGIWKRSRVAGLHGPLANWDDAYCGPESAEALRRALMTTEPIVLTRNPEALTAAVRVEGKATGFLMGGNPTWWPWRSGRDCPIWPVPSCSSRAPTWDWAGPTGRSRSS